LVSIIVACIVARQISFGLARDALSSMGIALASIREFDIHRPDVDDAISPGRESSGIGSSTRSGSIERDRRSTPSRCACQLGSDTRRRPRLKFASAHRGLSWSNRSHVREYSPPASSSSLPSGDNRTARRRRRRASSSSPSAHPPLFVVVVFVVVVVVVVAAVGRNDDGGHRSRRR